MSLFFIFYGIVVINNTFYCMISILRLCYWKKSFCLAMALVNFEFRVTKLKLPQQSLATPETRPNTYLHAECSEICCETISLVFVHILSSLL
jgi:hypothetical protein